MGRLCRPYSAYVAKHGSYAGMVREHYQSERDDE